ncbi:hypothetical protein Pelo_8825 [Pelomyxa schiedti]|nr:hypothetical protein Pelo_8825 [Pelomyxa schiedti]
MYGEYPQQEEAQPRTGGNFHPQQRYQEAPYMTAFPQFPPIVPPPGFYSKGVFYPIPNPMGTPSSSLSSLITPSAPLSTPPKVETTTPTTNSHTQETTTTTSSGLVSTPQNTGAARAVYPTTPAEWASSPYIYPYPVVPPYLQYGYNAPTYQNRPYRKFPQEQQDTQQFNNQQGQMPQQVIHRSHQQSHPGPQIQKFTVPQVYRRTSEITSDQTEKLPVAQPTGFPQEEPPLPTGDANFPSLAESKNKHGKGRSKRPEVQMLQHPPTHKQHGDDQQGGHGTKNTRHSGPKPLCLGSFLQKIPEQETPSNELWVGNIAENVTPNDIKELFLEFCDNVSVIVKAEKCCAFVTLDTVEQADKARLKRNDMDFHERKLSVHFRKPRMSTANPTGLMMDPSGARTSSVSNPPSRAVWIGDLAVTSEEEITPLASQFGQIESLKFIATKKCCFINYLTEKEAADAVQGLQGKTIGGKTFKVNFGKPYQPQYQGTHGFPGTDVYPMAQCTACHNPGLVVLHPCGHYICNSCSARFGPMCCLCNPASTATGTNN